MIALGVDPGTEFSAYCAWDGNQVLSVDKVPNVELLKNLMQDRKNVPTHLAIEWMQSYGQPVGREVFETCVWTGRFIQAFHGPWTKIYRKDVKKHILGLAPPKADGPRGTDARIRAALIELVGEPGTKNERGPTFGIRADMWSALAIAKTWYDTR